MTALKKTAFSLVASTLAIFVVVSTVQADGQYGQYGAGSESPSEQPKEEITHQTVDAGLGDNLGIVGLIAGGLGLSLVVISRITKHIYILD